MNKLMLIISILYFGAAMHSALSRGPNWPLYAILYVSWGVGGFVILILEVGGWENFINKFYLW